MVTQNDRLKYLRDRVKTLQSQVVEYDLQGEYAQMVKQISDRTLELEPVNDETWDLMLPNEQRMHLLAYYHTLRSELQMLLDEAQQQGSFEKATQWLDSPWVKRTVTLAAIAKVAIDVAILIAHSGLFFTEDDPDQIV